MSTSTIFRRMTPKKIMEGVFAVHKPTGLSSAQVLRDMQHHFNPSELFAPWLEAERDLREREAHNQRKRRKDKRIQVKIGHGGTLDPLATGVLIAGVGKGTKSLQDFLTCTKVYETVVLFGTSTDTYDRVGKVIRRAPYSHITKEMVEEALVQFRGKFMQLPPLFSALKMNGKPLYEYAREGKEIPREIERREVEVLNLELVEWMEGGTHSHVAPTDQAGHAEINVATKLWKQENVLPGTSKSKGKSQKSRSPSPHVSMEDVEAGTETAADSQKAVSVKQEDVEAEAVDLDMLQSKEGAAKSDANQTLDNKPTPERTIDEDKKDGVDGNASHAEHQVGGEASKGVAVESDIEEPSLTEGTADAEAAALSSFEQKKRKLSEDQDDLVLERPPPKSRKGKVSPPSPAEPAMMSGGLASPPPNSDAEAKAETTGPPAVRLRMTVTSGFYVRSLCHDLGAAVGSAALMAELERTRQGDFELGKNVLEYADLEQGEKVWGPKVEEFLDEWHAKTEKGKSN